MGGVLSAALYGAVHVPHFAAQAAGRLRPKLDGAPVVVMVGVRPLERVFAANTKARGMGLRTGMTRVEVESFAGVQLLPRSLSEEQGAEEILMEAAGVFTPRAEPQFAGGGPDWECLLDLSGTERLLGGPEEVGRKVVEHLRGLGFEATVALCENPDAGLSLARALTGGGRRSVQAVAAGEVRRALAPLPVGVLGLGEEAELFEAWGIRTLGELAALPEREMVIRMGQAGRRLLLRARGELPHLLQPREAGMRLVEALDFDDPVETLEPLLFCMNPMLEQIIRRAGSRAQALAAVTVRMKLFCPADRELKETPQTEEGGEFARTIRPAVATANRALLLKMLQLEMEGHPCPGAIVRLEMEGEPGPISRVQLGLFAPPMPEPTRFEDTHARLVAMVGETNVGRLRPLDTHRAESFVLERFRLPGDQRRPAREETRTAPATALRRLKPAVPVWVWMGEKAIEGFTWDGRRFRTVRCFGPWRSSGAWWGSEGWSVDTWDVAARAEEDGELVMCAVTHDLLRGEWRMEGIYD